MTPDRDDPGREHGALPASAPAPDEATDVRRMLHDRSRSITPRGTFSDLDARIIAADAGRRRSRALYSTAAAVVLVALVAGGIALANRDPDGTERIDTADSTTTAVATSTTGGEPTTTDGQSSTTTTDEAPGTTASTDPTPSTDPDDTGTNDTADTEPADTAGDGTPDVSGISARTPVRIDGIGPISIPLGVADAAATTGQPIAVDPSSIIDESNACRFARDPSLPGIWYMVDRDRIVRVDITGQGIPNRTAAGVGIDSSPAEVEAAYPGRVTEEPHPYAMDEDSRYLVVTDPAHPGYEIIFSVHQGRVQDYRAGLADFVRYPEGCA